MRWTVALLVLLAGCFGTSTTQDDLPDSTEPPVPAEALPFSPTNVCPPGGATRTDGLCVSTLADPTGGLQEPFLVVNPRNTNQMAVGTNAVATTQAANGPSPTPVNVYVTDDAGATWTLSPLPQVPPGMAPYDFAATAGDPSLAYHDGTLYVNWINFLQVDDPAGEYWLLLAQSDDNGKTWSDAALVEQGIMDRNWFGFDAEGRPVITWRQSDGQAHLRVLDESWQADWVEDCESTAPSAVWRNATWFACRSTLNDTAQLYRVSAQGLQHHAEIGASLQYQFLVPTDEQMVVVSHTRNPHDALLVYTSGDGLNWSAPTNVRDLTSLDDDWVVAQLMWYDADDQGRIHLLVGGGDSTLGERLNCRGHVDFDLAYLILGPDFELLYEHAIDVLPVDATAAGAGPFLAFCNDDFYGLDIVGNEATVMWSRHGELDWTRFSW